MPLAGLRVTVLSAASSYGTAKAGLLASRPGEVGRDEQPTHALGVCVEGCLEQVGTSKGVGSCQSHAYKPGTETHGEEKPWRV